ncbi:Permease of the drug/metabolite transporter (DMT) superfamily [Geitlerinema sp. FC II]|nr:Permease of the drug/metabolite transporter (DMT) superfamily [Geitlerinema sp. FC II]
MAHDSNRLQWNGQAFFLLAPFFFWGTAMVAMKGVMPHTTPFFMAGVRLVPAGGLVLLAAAIAKRPQPQTVKAWLWILLFALVDGAIFQGFLASGLVKTGAGLGSVAIDSQPLAVAVLSWLLFGEFIGFWGWLGLGTGLVGISAIGLPDEWFLAAFDLDFAATSVNIDRVFQQGEWLMLVAALSMAIGTVMMPKVSEHADPVVATGWHMILGGLPLWGISAAIEFQPWQQLTPTDWVALGYTTVFGSAVAYGLFFYFAARGNLTSLSSLTFFTPIFALLFGYWFLGEVLTPVQWVGASVTLVSVYLIERRDRLPSFSDLQGRSPASLSESTLDPSRAEPIEVPPRESSSEDSESKVLRS